MLKTIIEFMDGQVKEFTSRHISRTDKEAGVFRLLFEDDEIAIPLCNIRSVRTKIVPDQSVEEFLKGTTDNKNSVTAPGSAPVIDAEKEQKKKDEWTLEIPFLKRGKKE